MFLLCSVHQKFVLSCISMRTQNICITFVQSRPNVFDVGPTLYKCYTNVLFSLECSLFHRIRSCEFSVALSGDARCSVRLSVTGPSQYFNESKVLYTLGPRSNEYQNLTLKALIYHYTNHGNQKVSDQFEIIINVLVSSF